MLCHNLHMTLTIKTSSFIHSIVCLRNHGLHFSGSLTGALTCGPWQGHMQENVVCYPNKFPVQVDVQLFSRELSDSS